jgi:hypothetical protein
MFSLTGRSLVPLIPCYEIRHIRGYMYICKKKEQIMAYGVIGMMW